jgi:hypothetical protein
MPSYSRKPIPTLRDEEILRTAAGVPTRIISTQFTSAHPSSGASGRRSGAAIILGPEQGELGADFRNLAVLPKFE